MKKIFLTFTTLIFLLLSGRFVAAQNATPLTVSPVRQEITLNPGETSTINVRFYNQSGTPTRGIVRVADFIVDDASGTPNLIENAEQASPKFSAASWFTLVTDKVVVGGESPTVIQAKISVPENAHPGGRYAAIYLEAGEQSSVQNERKESAATGVTPRLVSLVYIKISGNITEDALLSRFFTKSFYEYGPIEVTAEILNRGDYHIHPRGIVSMTNFFSGLVAQEKLADINIFPDASRTYNLKLGSKWMLGRYRIDVATSYGDSGHAINRFLYVWVIPWKMITAVILTLIIIGVLVRALYLRFVKRESTMEKEINREQQEIEKLKEELRKKDGI